MASLDSTSRRKPSVLISGGSIAGPAVAWWLTEKYGFECTIVERWHELRKGGQNIDVRGAGRDVVRRMALESQIKQANTTETGTAFVDTNGKHVVDFPASANGPTAELEILRGDLAEILYDATTKSTVKWIFGDQIADIQDNGEDIGKGQVIQGPLVRFQSGKEERYDLVILADGVGSRTRKMVFGDEARVKPVGLHIAYLTIPRVEADDKWSNWYFSTGRKSILVRPDNKGTTRVCLSFLASEDDKKHDHDEPSQIDLLSRKFRNSGYFSDRIVSELNNPNTEIYYERLGQVLAPHYSRGRVVLLGDSAYCATPISGMGTTLSFVGAYILAGELAKEYNGDHDNDMYSKRRSAEGRAEIAFGRYQNFMKPFVARAQKLPPGAPGIIHPDSRFGVAVLYLVFRLVGWVVWLTSVLGITLNGVTPPADLDLPDYKAFEVAR